MVHLKTVGYVYNLTPETLGVKTFISFGSTQQQPESYSDHMYS